MLTVLKAYILNTLIKRIITVKAHEFHFMLTYFIELSLWSVVEEGTGT